jgi:hypothetical protein
MHAVYPSGIAVDTDVFRRKSAVGKPVKQRRVSTTATSHGLPVQEGIVVERGSIEAIE